MTRISPGLRLDESGFSFVYEEISIKLMDKLRQVFWQLMKGVLSKNGLDALHVCHSMLKLDLNCAIP